jgi:hypothetical protein
MPEEAIPGVAELRQDLLTKNPKIAKIIHEKGHAIDEE